MSYKNLGNYYPPAEHKSRIDRYKENKQLFKGEHWDLFRKYNIGKRGKLYISVNLAGLIAKKSADFLIGDGVQVSAGKEDNSPEQVALDRFREENELDILFYESAIANAYRGDSFFKVRYGQEFAGLYPKEVDAFRVRIETIPAKYVFPETAKHDANKIVAYHVAIPVVDAENSNKKAVRYKLQVESHYSGKIVYEEFKLTVVASEVDGTPSDYRLGEQIGQSVVSTTGIPYPLVVHVPNFSLDDSWEGMDDLTEIKPLFDELNNRLSQIADIMDKHSNPALALPPNILVEDEDGNARFRVADGKVFEIDDKDIIPQYITWNGQLQEAYSEIDRLIQLILATAEIPEVALGMGDSGTSGNSGLAIKWRMNSLLSKINRKRKYYEKALKRVFLLAQMLEQALGIAEYELVTPKLIFSDGLPKDEMEQTSIALQKTGGAVLQSQKSAIMKLEGLTEEQAEAEVARIIEQQKAEADRMPKATPSIFNGFTDIEEDEEDAAVI